ncbi:MAG: FAD-dependent oxidoreductase [Planctomycetes bacterium]|nr:FAD-dependent oxidoreductase [Planctomycetota bacterium]
MRTPRRHALRIAIAGPVLAGCPIHSSAAPSATALDSERYADCHRVRDGAAFPRPSRWRDADLVILGGGISGLSAARLCRDHDVVVLEKELLPGGHAQSTTLGGIPCSVGTAYVGRGDAAGLLAAELGLPLLPVASWDGTADQGTFTPDTWGDGLDHLPYPRAVREDFAACRRDLLALAPDDERHDATPLAALLAPYGDHVRRWWDAYCPSNWGGSSADVAASLAIDTLHWWAGPDRSDSRVTWPGGVGALARRLAADIATAPSVGVVTGATVLSLSRAGHGVEVTYVAGEQVTGIRAKAAIVALPKFVTTRIVAGLPADQRGAMERIHYAPYCVVNVRCDRPVPRLGYDTWCPGRRFTDCIVADWVGTASGDARGDVLTCYVPLAEDARESLLDDDHCRALAAAVADDLHAAFPEGAITPVEAHLYRRGHAIHCSAPGLRNHQLRARRPFGPIAFAHGDVGSLVASSAGAIRAARRAVDDVAAFL